MKMIICAIKDLGSQTFSRPQFFNHTNIAIRSFMDEVNRPSTSSQPNDLNAHADDFELYELGSYDDSTGTFECPDSPALLSQAKQVLNIDS